MTCVNTESMINLSPIKKIIAVVATSAVVLGSAPATSSAQALPPLPPLPSPEEIQAIAAAAVVVIGAAAAASSGDSPLGNLNLGSSGTESPPASTQSRYLSDMRPVSGSPRIGSRTINGVAYANSVAREFGGCAQSVNYGYDLGRNWSRFQATVGISDNSRSNSVVQYEFYGDGRKLGNTVTSRLGTATPVNLDVSGVLRLELRATFVEGDKGLCSRPGNWVWGNARITR